MKKVISFEKELDFPSMIGEITSISLDNSLKFIDKSNIEGKFLVSGTYKMTEASTLEEEFKYDIPIEISLTETFDLENVKVSIDDFHYEVVNDDILKCNIYVLIDGIEEIIIDDIEQQPEIKDEDVRECDGDKEKKEKELPKKEKKEKENNMNEIKQEEKQKEKPKEKKETKTNYKQKEKIIEDEEEKESEITIENNGNITSLFETLASTEETYTTYSIYILRKEDTIEKIMDKYNVTKEELNDYNDLDNLEIGSKIVIPTTVNE